MRAGLCRPPSPASATESSQSSPRRPRPTREKKGLRRRRRLPKPAAAKGEVRSAPHDRSRHIAETFNDQTGPPRPCARGAPGARSQSTHTTEPGRLRTKTFAGTLVARSATEIALRVMSGRGDGLLTAGIPPRPFRRRVRPRLRTLGAAHDRGCMLPWQANVISGCDPAYPTAEIWSSPCRAASSPALAGELLGPTCRQLCGHRLEGMP